MKHQIYVTFDRKHVHRVNGETLDYHCVGIIYCNDHNHGREIAKQLFRDRFCGTFEPSDRKINMRHFPRGFIEVNRHQKLGQDRPIFTLG